jgi:hypothetical protein
MELVAFLGRRAEAHARQGDPQAADRAITEIRNIKRQYWDSHYDLWESYLENLPDVIELEVATHLLDYTRTRLEQAETLARENPQGAESVYADAGRMLDHLEHRIPQLSGLHYTYRVPRYLESARRTLGELRQRETRGRVSALSRVVRAQPVLAGTH